MVLTTVVVVPAPFSPGFAVETTVLRVTVWLSPLLLLVVLGAGLVFVLVFVGAGTGAGAAT